MIRYTVINCIKDIKLDNRVLNVIERWTIPKLPISGNDVLKIKKIKKINIGKILKLIEEWWVRENFKPNKAECLNKLKSY